jgi:hypothetical protein
MTGNYNNKAGFSLPSNDQPQGLSSMKSAECEVNPVNKPTELYNAIRQMHYLSIRIDNLYERINTGSPINGDEANEDENRDVCLLEVLNESPQIIREHLDYQHQRIIDIEQSIFNR